MKTGLVLEGGACRGVFTTGVLDVFQQRGISFDYCIGVSAGAGNAMNYKSRQPGRCLTLLTEVGGRPYFGFATVKASGNVIDLDYLYDELSFGGRIPFDFTAYHQNPMQCEYVLTDCRTGGPAYLQEEVYHRRLTEIIKGSCAMPGFCKSRVIDGVPYLDGGVSDPLPVRRALEQGCDRVVLVMTKPPSNLHPTDYRRLRPVLYKLYGRRYPALYQSLMNRVQRYFSQLAEVEDLEKEGKLFVIRPESCRIKGLEKDRQKMREYYYHGRKTALRQIPVMEDYLKS